MPGSTIPESRGEGITIPDEMADSALAVLRQRFFAKFPELKSLWSEDRQQEALQAIETLRLWAKGQYHCAPPAEKAAPEDQAGGTPVKFLGTKPQTSGRRQTSGLI